MLISDLKGYKSSVVSDSSVNGGYLSYNQIVTNVLNNVFPNVTYTERTNGINRYRKVFFKNDNSSNEALFNSHVALASQSGADDLFYLFAGTNSDTQGNVVDELNNPITTKLYGSGVLKADVSAGVSSVTATFEASDFLIEAGDKVLITDKPSLTGAGTEEYLTVSSVSWVGLDATITFTTPLNGSYSSATPTYVSTMLPLGTIVGSASVDSVTSASGSVLSDTNPIVVGNQGGIDEVWTITFTSTTAFTCVGARTSFTGSGNIVSNFSINNPQTLSDCFNIPNGFWSGSWTVGDTVVFTTVSSSKGFWILEKVPAGANTYSDNSVNLRFYGE